MNPIKKNLLDYDLDALREWVGDLGEKPYRGTQLYKWIHQQQVSDFELMTNLNQSFKKLIESNASVQLPDVALDRTTADGTRKWLLRLADGNCIETVYIPEKQRGTLCVSSQIGCGLNCSFCATGKQGFSRNLTTGEIIGQLWLAIDLLKKTDPSRLRWVTNVVFMGMGEPLLNFDAVLRAINMMLDDQAYGLSKYRVTLSTSGLVPLMDKLKHKTPAALAVSLHAPNDRLRDTLVPINKKYPLVQLMESCRNYFANEPKRDVTFEYVMLKDVNDSLTHAKQLITLLQDVPAKVNLIPFNGFSGSGYECSSREVMLAFQQRVSGAGINVTIRKTRGEEIDAACGQLSGQVFDKTRRTHTGRKRLEERTKY